jgi:hypothetical protein
MFGLMKPHHCSVSVNKEEKRQYRLYYCGICKTIGSRYGHKMRLFLNHDITFFAEILAELSGESKEENQWDPAFYRSNCFILPGEQDRIPLSFSIAAAVNILLAKLTIDDNVEDSKRATVLWKWVKTRVSKRELNALKQLEAWKFPLERILTLAHQQKIREQEPHKYSGAGAELDYFSESTAVITGIIFQNAARISGKKSVIRDMFTLGFLFGQLVYLLDAWEDFERDSKKGDFNAIAAAYHISGMKPGENCKHDVSEIIGALSRKIISRLNRLPISREKNRLFAQRLKVNLNKRLRAKDSKRIAKQGLTCTPPGLTGPHRAKRWRLGLAVSPAGSIGHIKLHKFSRYLQFSFFALSLPVMFGLRYLPFAATPPEGGKTRNSCADTCFCCDCCPDCCCECCEGEGGCCCSNCHCDCCDCCDC